MTGRRAVRFPLARAGWPASRLRSSLLLKILAALLVALVGSSLLTTFVESRLTSSILDTQARRVASTNLGALQRAYFDRERTLLGTIRNLRESILNQGLLDRSAHSRLIGDLGSATRNLELETLQVLEHDGSPRSPPVGVGTPLADRPELSATDRLAPASLLLPSAEGGWLQAVAIPIGADDDAPLLIGAYDFGDAFSYELRRHFGLLGVVLVVEGEVVGSNLVDPPRTPPGRHRDGRLPSSPVGVRMGDEKALAVYQPIGGTSGGAPAALGVVVTDAHPEASLDSALARTRTIGGVLLAVVVLALGWLLFRALVNPLVALKRTAGRIAEGDLEASFVASGSDEIAALGRSLERMRRELRTQLDLIAEQAEDLQHSSQRIVAAQDEERHRLARDLHDGIQQQLIVLRMGLGLLKEAAERSPGPVAEGLEQLSAEHDAVIEHLREVSHDLYPSILVDRGLAPALRTRLARLPVPAKLVCEPNPFPRLAPEIESGAYFLVSEALANALKHAGASEITVRLDVDEGWLRVAVRDDGQGFAAGDQPRRGGLLHMEDRARSFGGELHIASERGAGTEVRATFPLRSPAGTSV